jgi:hypothetical protein
MRSLKTLYLAAAALAAMAAFATSSASATTLTGSGGTDLETGTIVSGATEGTTVYHPPFGDLECQESSFSGKISNAGSSTETAKVTLETLSFSQCNTTYTVLKAGILEFHTSGSTADNNGTLTSNGTELTTEFIGTHCIFSTSNTSIGTVTGSSTTGGNATLDISATIPRTGGRSGAFCGSTAQWTGSYKFTSPSVLNID